MTNKSEKELLGKYKLVLGLEVHIQPKLERKMFCGCKADIWKAEPNTLTCPTCLGLPGALPVPNEEAVRKTHLLGLALNCALNRNSRFDRKHYFYPDLPKGYQISQYKQPLCGEGYLELSSGSRADIERIHLEEDAAKSFHEGKKTLIDFNKGGLALIELVTKPTFSSIEDAVDFGKKLREVVRALGVSDADMEKGQMRLEPNISLRTEEMEKSEELPSYKVEVKNINSFKFMEKVVRAEIIRQRELLEKDETPVQENRGFDEKSGKTVSQRSKEEAHDYRYFPEPDIPPMEFSNEYFEELKKSLGDLPGEKTAGLAEKLGISEEHAQLLVAKDLQKQLEELVEAGVNAEKATKLLLNKKEFQNISVEEFKEKLDSEGDKISEIGELEGVIQKVIEENSKVVSDYRSGKKSALQFLIGMAMKETGGKADAGAVKNMLSEKLV
jgi:aspartyl-tRNA(Asn)/glutamyl-tRNA(Gln) amidotransferase subunit B